MSFYGNVTYYLTNAFGKMVFRNDALLNPDSTRRAAQKNAATNGSRRDTQNSVQYDLEFLPQNKNDSFIVASGNRWISFAKNSNANNTTINGINTVLLYHTLPNEFVNATDDGSAVDAWSVIDSNYYKLTQVIGRNYTKNKNQTTYVDINPGEIEENLQPDENPTIVPYSNWGDILAIPQIVYDAAGHIVKAGNNYVRLQKEPAYGAQLSNITSSTAAVLNVLFGSRFVPQSSDAEEQEAEMRQREQSLLTEYKDLISMNNKYYMSDQVKNVISQVNTNTLYINEMLIANNSLLNRIGVELGVLRRQGATSDSPVSIYPEGTNHLNMGGLIKEVALQEQTFSARFNTLEIAIGSIASKVNDIIALINRLHDSSEDSALPMSQLVINVNPEEEEEP